MTSIPIRGRSWDDLSADLDRRKAGDYSWRKGRLALYFYYLDDELVRVQQQAYLKYWTENNLGQRAFPSLKSLEDEVVAMGKALIHAPEGSGATFTSGGSESIFLAVKAARDWGRAERGVTGKANLVAPQTAHLTFDRAAEYLDLDVRRAPTGAEGRADVAAMEALIDENTVMLVGSAPNYPFGVFDPIGALGELAQRRGLWLHVDACVGGFLTPWTQKLQYPAPDWDFTVPGVTSISADLHKYGMAAKGASLLLVREERLRQYHRFASQAWERGPYAAYTTQGTRAGGAVAAAWATMNYLGEEGYLRCARMVMDAKRIMTDGIDQIPGLEVLKPHESAIFVYHSTDPDLDIAKVAAALDAMGWLVSRQLKPDGIHLALNPVHLECAEEYVSDVRAAAQAARSGKVDAMATSRTY